MPDGAPHVEGADACEEPRMYGPGEQTDAEHSTTDGDETFPCDACPWPDAAAGPECAPDQTLCTFCPERTDGKMPDGGEEVGDFTPLERMLMDARNRLTSVEKTQQYIRDTLENVDETVEEVHQELGEVEDDALTEDNYATAIDKNTRIRIVAKWGGGAVIAASSVAVALSEIGVLP